MNWFWNDWVLIGISVAIAAIGFPLGYMGVINGELAILSLMPLGFAVIVAFWFAMIWVLKGSIEATDHLTRNWPGWARDLIGISHFGSRPRGLQSEVEDDSK